MKMKIYPDKVTIKTIVIVILISFFSSDDNNFSRADLASVFSLSLLSNQRPQPIEHESMTKKNIDFDLKSSETFLNNSNEPFLQLFSLQEHYNNFNHVEQYSSLNHEINQQDSKVFSQSKIVDSASKFRYCLSLNEKGPNFNVLHSIISKYILSPKTIENIISKIERLNVEDVIVFNDIMKNLSNGSRLNEVQKRSLIDELRSSGIVIVTETKKNSFKLKRGPNFQKYN